MSTLNFQDGYRRSSSVTLQLCSKVSAYKFLAQTTMIYHIWEQKYEDQFATSNCNIFKAIEEGGFMKNEIPFISIGTIFERLFIKGIIFRIVQEIISINKVNFTALTKIIQCRKIIVFHLILQVYYIRTICFSKMWSIKNARGIHFIAFISQAN